MDTTNKLAEEALRAEWMKTFAAPTKKTFLRNPDGTYVNRYVEDDWQHWQNAAKVDATPSADQATQPAEAETEQSIAADSYWNIAETMGTLDGYSVQEHVQTMREVMQRCSDYLHDIHGSSEGGDDEGVALAADVRNCLSGHIDLVSSESTEVDDES